MNPENEIVNYLGKLGLLHFLPNNKKDNFITVTFYSDGSPVFESSSFVTQIYLLYHVRQCRDLLNLTVTSVVSGACIQSITNKVDSLTHIREYVDTERSVYGFIKKSVLTDLNSFNIISGFVPDSMHLIDLCIAKQFMNKALRYSRSIHDKKFWIAKDLQNWVLYYSTIVLLKIPKMKPYVEHWSNLTNVARSFGKVSLPTHRWIRELNLSDWVVVYKKIVKAECCYLSCNKIRLRSNISFAKATDNELNMQEYTVCKSIHVTDIFDNNIRNFQIKRIVDIIENLRANNTITVDKICFHMDCDNESYL
ncbi:hypothetical protein TSAR_005706 [Trichomalopsis sarcophagae]|uniref:Uncharacterized protein n=1 Tax=Trichomalopsis sarcophagae TaxID=543379 RepID=A0A232F8G3_9HYME|nr:hypothetical protein TSAR_005706 [Trichomalopsis sarcophagae]